MIDLGDLTWNKEMELACPEQQNRHGRCLPEHAPRLDASNCPAIVHALQPRVAIVNNGETKGGAPEALRTIRSSRESRTSGSCITPKNARQGENAPEPFIVNVTRTAA